MTTNRAVIRRLRDQAKADRATLAHLGIEFDTDHPSGFNKHGMAIRKHLLAVIEHADRLIELQEAG